MGVHGDVELFLFLLLFVWCLLCLFVLVINYFLPSNMSLRVDLGTMAHPVRSVVVAMVDRDNRYEYRGR